MLNPWIEAWQLRDLVLRDELRPRQVAEFFLGRIEALNTRYGAFMTVTADRALEDARRLESLTSDQRAALPLCGVPYSLKDLTWTKGIRTTLGSKNFANFIPKMDQEYAAKIAAAGGILLGKTTTPEFGGKPTTDGGLCPPAQNPWNPACTAGGSSGGAAVSVAAGMNPVAEGSDGGGSIRVPAACCGIVGLKPSRGRVSNAPVMGEGWAGFATNGPLASSVRDAALLLDVMAGAAVGDPYAAPPPPHRFIDALKLRPRNLRLGVIAASALGALDDEISTSFAAGCDVFRAMGHRVERLNLDPGAQLKDVVAKLICAGVSSIPVQHPDWMDPDVRISWERGRAMSAADYVGAVARMHNISRSIVRDLIPYDAILTPTLTQPPRPLGAGPALDDAFGWLPFTFPFNATGQPAISLPTGFTRSGLPIGLQVVGRPNDEIGIIAIAAQFEETRPWRDQHPPID